MKKCFRKKILSVFLVPLSIIMVAEQAQAQAIVSDSQSTIKTIKQWFTEVKESKTVVSTMQTIQKTNAAIGTAKKSVSEYVLANKEKLEEKIAKVQEYKKKAEAYKEEYDNYRKQLDENIAKARELKEQAETKINSAKETISDAKSSAEGVLAQAKEKVGLPAEPEVSDDAILGADVPSTQGQNVAISVAPESSVGGQLPSRMAFEKAEEKNFSETSKSVKASQETAQKIDSLSEDEKTSTSTDISSQTQAVGERNTTTSIFGKPAVSSSIVKKGTLTEGVIQPITDTPAVTAPVKSIQQRKAFTISSLHKTESLMFAKVEMLNLPDGGTDANGVVIIPKALAMYCGLSSGDALEAGKVDECLQKLNKERNSAQLFSGSDAPKVYNLAMAQYVAASIAEAYKARQDADSFEEKFVDAIDFAPEPTTQDVYDNIVELNKAIDMQMNGLLRVFSTQLAIQSLYKYRDYAFAPKEDKGEENE